jgi:hypothetical protein
VGGASGSPITTGGNLPRARIGWDGVLREIATIVTPDTLHTETIFGVNRQARFPVTA